MADVKIDSDMVRAFLHMRKTENLEQFRKPAVLTGAPVPVFCCINCSTLYLDAVGETPIYDDGRESLKECSCKQVELVDARSLKFDYEAPVCVDCGTVFERADKTVVLAAGSALAAACAHPKLGVMNARERNVPFWEDEKGVIKSEPAPVPLHIVRAVRIPVAKEVA